MNAVIEFNHVKDDEYEIKLDIQPIADRLGISKEKLAELMANELMKILGIKNE